MKRTVLGIMMAALVIACAAPIRYTVEEIKAFPPAIQEKIEKGEISTGMTMLQVRYAWGAPSIVNVLPPTDRARERVEWTYKRMGGVFRSILTFEDNRLVEIRSNEPGVIK